MTPLSAFPGGTSLDGGRFVVSTRRHGGSRWGIYRGYSRCTRVAGAMLITVGPRQTRSHAELLGELALPIAGVAPLVHIGPVAGGPRGDLDGLVEREPGGRPVSDYMLPLAPGVAMALVREIGCVLGEIHEREVYLGGLQPHLIYVKAVSGGLELTGIAPRGPIFAHTAGDAREQPRPFHYSYTPPEGYAGRTGAAADVFSLCALASHWLTGVHPFQGPRHSMVPQALARELGGGRSATTRDWPRLIDRGLSEQPRQRPPLGELVGALEMAQAA
ncbi:MAG TPA: hypothetical protein VMZ28_20285 [Kofleriaceae bacterium]|nr:hypothetical protein [Kofleriaceae bacterium]